MLITTSCVGAAKRWNKSILSTTFDWKSSSPDDDNDTWATLWPESQKGEKGNIKKGKVQQKYFLWKIYPSTWIEKEVAVQIDPGLFLARTTSYQSGQPASHNPKSRRKKSNKSPRGKAKSPENSDLLQTTFEPLKQHLLTCFDWKRRMKFIFLQHR